MKSDNLLHKQGTVDSKMKTTLGSCTLLPFQQSTLSPIIAYQRMCLCVLIHCSAITITINITVDNVLLFLRSGTYIGMYCIAIVFIMRYVTEVLNTHTQKVPKLESDNSHSSIVGINPLSPYHFCKLHIKSFQ